MRGLGIISCEVVMKDRRYWVPLEKLTEIREKKKMTQERLGELTGMTQEAISRYENGKVTPNVDSRKKLANALGVKEEELFECII